MRTKRGFIAIAFVALVVSARADSVESYLEAPGPLGPLKGTLLQSGTGHAPVILIIPGSGPTDRDGNSPLGIKASTYKLLAEGLGKNGISSVRIDKRGMFASAGAVLDGNAVTIADYVSDIHSWVGTIRQKTGVPCVWVLGHSEGALVALATAQNEKDICGLILVSAAGRPMGEVLRRQLQANPANAPLLDQASGAIDTLEAGKSFDVTNLNPALMPLFNPKIQGFLMSEFSYDPAKLVSACKKPVLLVQGERDIQISSDDAELLKAANPGAQLLLLPDANHLLKQVSTDSRGANVATYADPSLPLAPGVIDPIAKFVNSNTPKR
jgi:pimeloyl-ACP methyl ester carboxylesterase